jgi:hypothetical protein
MFFMFNVADLDKGFAFISAPGAAETGGKPESLLVITGWWNESEPDGQRRLKAEG